MRKKPKEKVSRLIFPTCAQRAERGLAIAAVFRNEGPYILEWLEFHKLAGVEHFILFDNGSTDNSREVLIPAEIARIATVLNWRGSQLAAYRKALLLFRRTFSWIAFIDIDEFLFPNSGLRLGPQLTNLGDASCLLVPWTTFGPNGLEKRDIKRSVILDFTRSIGPTRPDFPARAEKTKPIVNPVSVSRTGVHQPVLRHSALPQTLADSVNPSIRLHHYVSKSWHEFAEKKARNSVATAFSPRASRNDEVVAYSERWSVENRAAVDFLIRHRDAGADLGARGVGWELLS
jgi:glycosyltransferase involved in cell wall biosynthesis